MQYLGGKTRQSTHIVPIILREGDGCRRYIEPFMGSGAIFHKVAPHFSVSIASDTQEDLILMWKAARDGWVPPAEMSREQYTELRNAKPSALRGFAAFGLSFGGKWFAGYATNARGDDYCRAAQRNVIKRSAAMSRATIQRADYRDYRPGPFDLVYCDPPYAGTTSYGGVGDFDTAEFWNTALSWSHAGATVLVSEYGAPNWAECIWEREATVSLKKDNNAAKAVERLYLVA